MSTLGPQRSWEILWGEEGGRTGLLVTLYCQQKPYVWLPLCAHFLCSTWSILQLALRPSRDYNGCSVLRRYFAQLHLLRARFPPETIGQLPIDFAWWERCNPIIDKMHPSQMQFTPSIQYVITRFMCLVKTWCSVIAWFIYDHHTHTPLSSSGKMCIRMLSISRRDCR